MDDLKPDPAQLPPESVWDYPRPPRLEPVTIPLRILHRGETIASTTRGLRILETSHPPVYYICTEDIAMEWLCPAARRQSFCEFKGLAAYWDLALPGAPIVRAAAWSYEQPTAPYAALRGYLAFYANAVDECWVGGERVQPQPGDFYGGWITSNLRGPFKGAPGTLHW